MNLSEEKNTSEEYKADLVKNTEVYKGIEAMITLQVAELSELIEKLKSAKTKTSQKLYQKKIDKKRDKILKYIFQLDKLTKGKVQEVMEELEKEVDEDIAEVAD